VWRPQTPQFTVPYAPVIVDVDEGYQMLSTLIGCRVRDIHAGMRVVVDFRPIGERVLLPCFRPSNAV
jgi:hypothetical protein